ncbi:MAG: MBL fold metallo-hydrolase [Desulfobulbaceae bacterium]|nr:MAG: MBL fold metallo-hydrolase [Desulfobulbaceae bacterium]
METRMLIFLSCLFAVGFLFVGGCVILSQPRFGKLPGEERFDLINQSPQYKDGNFQNPQQTPLFSTDDSTLSVLWSGLFTRKERLVPEAPLPAMKTDLRALDPRQNIVVWLGHSSWFIQLDGKRIVIDPILSDYAAPFPFMNRAFAGTSVYTPEDMPEIDALLISHDHWDHLDYPTVKALRPKVKQVICPLGVGAYFEHWGFPTKMISEEDWGDTVEIGKDFTVHLLPARHYSGRLFTKNKTLWAGFALVTSHRRIFFSGDSGHGPHFSDIGQAFNGFDLVLLDCGQYDPRWSYIHMTPEEAVTAAQDLGAKTLIPAHIGRFTIANHPWDEPFQRLTVASESTSFRLVIPQIGEPVALDNPSSQSPEWWSTGEFVQKVAQVAY